jgi:hypothetical protein
MKISDQQALAVRCSACGAQVGEKCELGPGIPRTTPHRDRALASVGEFGTAESGERGISGAD